MWKEGRGEDVYVWKESRGEAVYVCVFVGISQILSRLTMIWYKIYDLYFDESEKDPKSVNVIEQSTTNSFKAALSAHYSNTRWLCT